MKVDGGAYAKWKERLLMPSSIYRTNADFLVYVEGASLVDVCAFRQKRFNFFNLLCNWIHKIIYYYTVCRVWANFNWIDLIWNSFRGWACDATGQQTFDNIELRVNFNGNNENINQIRFSDDLSWTKHSKITIFRLSNEERGICLPASFKRGQILSIAIKTVRPMDLKLVPCAMDEGWQCVEKSKRI